MAIRDMILAAISLGLIYGPMALGVFIAFSILKTPDLTIDGSFVFGMTVCAMVTVAGHPYLGLVAGTAAGMAAGLVTGFLQTTLGIPAILSGVLTMTGLYTVNYAVLGGQSNRYLQSLVKNEVGVDVPQASPTIFRLLRLSDNNTVSELILASLILVCVMVGLAVFFKTRSGMALRAIGDNEEMVRSSSINADLTRTLGIMLANGLVALSGALLTHQQRYADLGNGSGMLVVGLASVIIGQALFGRNSVTLSILSAATGSVVYRLILQGAYQFDMPSYMVKLLSALIVTLSLVLPQAQARLNLYRLRRANERRLDQ